MKSIFAPLALGAALIFTTLLAVAGVQQNLGPMAGIVELGQSGDRKAEDPAAVS